jgi:hypothetical protein
VAPVRLVPVIVTVVPAAPLVGLKLVIVGAGGRTVKLAVLVAVPEAVVTARVPVVAAAGTVAVICVSETTVYVAAVPLKATAVAPVRFVPVIVTVLPAAPLVGLTLVIAGAGGRTVKLAVLVAVPDGVVTARVPVVAAAGTVAVIWVSETTVYVAAVPLKATAVAPVRLVPVIVTVLPGAPLGGAKFVIAGAGGRTVKLVPLVAVPPGVVTLIEPLAAPAGTVAVICVAESTVYVAAAPLNATAVAPVRFVPVIVTVLPAAPLVGLKLPIVGAGGATTTVKLAVLVAVPPGVVTETVPLVVPAATVAVIWVAESTV